MLRSVKKQKVFQFSQSSIPISKNYTAVKKFIFALFVAGSQLCSAQPGLSEYVNPFIGTGGHGHTYPGATVPYGMVQLSPDTRKDGSWDGCGGYYYNDSLILGFSHTHLSGTGCSDYGDIMLLPIKDRFDFKKEYSSRFSHSDEIAKAGYYSVFLKDQLAQAELTATERTGFHRYSYRSGVDSANVLIDLRHRDQLLDAQLYQVDKTHLAGFRRSSAWAKNQLVYFYIEFSEPIVPDNVHADSISHPADEPKLSAWAGNVVGGFRFKLNQDRNILIKVALSAVSVDGAKKNMKKELPDWDFTAVKQEATSKWNQELGKIEVISNDQEKLKIFYSALYHCMIVPNLYNDVDGKYLGRDFKVHKGSGNYYTVFSLWDTFRAYHPLMTLIDRKRTLDYVRTFLLQFEQGGMLPVWELSSNETECMIGYHSVSVISDAYAKGINDFDVDLAMKAMHVSAETEARFGLKAYMDHGFLDVMDESESVSKTLEYAYDDWCIAIFADRSGHRTESAAFYKRSQSWRNLFDPETKFIRPRKNGRFLEPFNPREVNNNFTEANAWQYTFFVPQDVPGLIRAIGGVKEFEKKLDLLFSENSQTTGREQADITGLIGQYAHGNEPSHHMAFLYNYTEDKWKTQYFVNKVRREMYRNNADGLIGNEDCGQMSAWYVLSSLGLYQICPGDPTYCLTTPEFSEITVHLENGKSLKILSPQLNEANQYIESVTINGAAVNSVRYDDLMEGGQLTFNLTSARGKWKNGERGDLLVAANTAVVDSFLPVPVVKYASDLFKNNIEVELSAETGAKIFYSINGESPAKLYTEKLTIDKSDTLKCFAQKEGTADFQQGARTLQSQTVTTRFHKIQHPDWKVSIKSEYNPQYTAGGDEGIIDGLFADVDWRKGGWQGYQGQQFEATIDMGKSTSVSSFYGDFLQDTRSWILMPKNVVFDVSDDGVNFTEVLRANNSIADTVLTNTIQKLGGKLQSPITTRYVRVRSDYYGKLPSWHPGAGGETFIFIDEIVVE